MATRPLPTWLACERFARRLREVFELLAEPAAVHFHVVELRHGVRRDEVNCKCGGGDHNEPARGGAAAGAARLPRLHELHVLRGHRVRPHRGKSTRGLAELASRLQPGKAHNSACSLGRSLCRQVKSSIQLNPAHPSKPYQNRRPQVQAAVSPAHAAARASAASRARSRSRAAARPPMASTSTLSCDVGCSSSSWGRPSSAQRPAAMTATRS